MRPIKRLLDKRPKVLGQEDPAEGVYPDHAVGDRMYISGRNMKRVELYMGDTLIATYPKVSELDGYGDYDISTLGGPIEFIPRDPDMPAIVVRYDSSMDKLEFNYGGPTVIP